VAVQGEEVEQASRNAIGTRASLPGEGPPPERLEVGATVRAEDDELAVRRALRAGRAAIASTTSGNLVVASRPVRSRRVTLARSLAARTRNPSNLSS
jgi:hypothetical protein